MRTLLNRLTRFNRYGLRMDLLWVVTVLAGCLFLGSLVPQPPNDFWWHLKIGEIIFETRRIPETNMFAWTLPSDAPFVYGAWLSELVFYVFFHVGNLELVIFLRNLLLGFTLVFLAWEVHRRCGSWKLTALGVGLTFVMMMNNLIIRPQNWSWLGFMFFVWLLNRYADDALSGWELTLACSGIMMFWVNLHGAFVLGPVLVATYFFGEMLQKILRLSVAWSWSKILGLLGCLLLCLVATVVNPQGVGIFRYVYNLMTDAPSQQLIVEWQSPSPEGPSNLVFFGSILGFMMGAWYARVRPRIRDVLLIAGFLWLAWSGVRYVMWFGLIAMPILAEVVASLIGELRFLHAPHRNLLNVGIACLLFIPVILAQPWFVGSLRGVLPPRYWDMVLPSNRKGPLLGVENPVDVVDFLDAHPNERMYCEMGYGSYFIWALPEQPVFADPRVELYPYEFWKDYQRISNGVRATSLLEEYGVSRVVLDVDLQKELSITLHERDRWKLVFTNDRTEVWDRVVGF